MFIKMFIKKLLSLNKRYILVVYFCIIRKKIHENLYEKKSYNFFSLYCEKNILC